MEKLNIFNLLIFKLLHCIKLFSSIVCYNSRANKIYETPTISKP